MSVLQRYLDYNATCPPVEAALEVMVTVAREAPGNPSSLHWAGRAARRIVDDARERVAEFTGADAGSVVFTSGGTEANNLAVYGHLTGEQPGRIVTSAIEHPSVLRALDRWSEAGWEVVALRPDREGVVSADAVADAVNEETRMVCLQAANNETGAMQPIAEVGAICREHGVAFLVDAVQALGKASVDMRAWHADFVALSGHKIGGPKGVGALLVRRGRSLSELISGGGQERKRRSGTENVPGIAGFSAALGINDFSVTEAVRDGFEASLKARLPGVRIFSEMALRVPNTSMFCVPGLDGETLLMQLDLAGFAVASGSACSSGKRDPSHVLLAMGCSHDQARSSVRVSFGPENSLEDAEALVEELVRIRERLTAMAGVV